jgi:hypothetical protein
MNTQVKGNKGETSEDSVKRNLIWKEDERPPPLENKSEKSSKLL